MYFASRLLELIRLRCYSQAMLSTAGYAKQSLSQLLGHHEPLTATYCSYKLTVVAASVDAVLDALGDRTRRTILERLSAGPVAVGVLADQLPVSRPAVSQHLKVLKDAGLVVELRRRHPAAVSRRQVRIAGRARIFLTAVLGDRMLDNFAILAEAGSSATTPANQEPGPVVSRKG